MRPIAPAPALTRRLRPVAALVLAASFGLASARAEEVETDATDLPAVLKAIAELEKLLTDGVSSNNSRALRSLQTAAASPKATLEFYLEAKKDVDFDSVGKTDAEWRAWRDANEAETKETMNVAARQMQLRYLVLCLQATSGPADEREETLKKALPLLNTYLGDLAERFPKLEGGQDIVAGSALDSEFAKHLKLHLTMDKKSGWPNSAADVSGIYERVILPYFRNQGEPAALLAAWDKRIIHEAGVLRTQGGGNGGGGPRGFRRGDEREVERAKEKEESRLEDEAKEKFTRVRLPELQWAKERDGLLYGADRAAAYAKLTQLLRSNLDHPAAQAWLGELKKLAEGNYKPEPAPEDAR